MLPINTLKIDKSFIDDICKDDGHKDITDGIIQLAHKINLDVIIEGVETAGQVKLLQDMNCNAIQGYYFSAPVPVEELEILLEKGYFDI
jgi:EAL domain-containing protein (putative c-di-GMP-specific phosphodiesterase class I)